jgi:hypothetical protein
VLLRAADDLYPGHNQLTVVATVTAPVRATPRGASTRYVQAGTRALLPLVLHDDANLGFHNCSAVHASPAAAWLVEGDTHHDVHDDDDTSSSSSVLRLFEDVELSALPPGVCTAAAVVGGVVAIPAKPVTVTAAVRLDASLMLRTSWRVVVFPPLRPVLYDCAHASPSATDVAAAQVEYAPLDPSPSICSSPFLPSDMRSVHGGSEGPSSHPPHS